MFGESIISVVSLWASMNSWLTPTVLFLLLNLMIGTIAVTSGLTSTPKSKPTSDHPLSRSPSSVLHRLRSINLYRSPPPEPLFYHAAPDPKEANAADGGVVIVKREEEKEEENEEDDDDGEGPTMEEVFSRIQQGNSAFGRSKSDGGRPQEPKKVRKRIIKKAASDVTSVLGGFEPVAETEQIRQWAGPDDEVDGKAEDFINRFRKQLNLQRQDSIYSSGA